MAKEPREAETRNGWLIERTKPTNKIVAGRHGSYTLNRTEFYGALVKEFEDYLTRLRDSTNVVIRKNFLKKMDDLCLAEQKP